MDFIFFNTESCYFTFLLFTYLQIFFIAGAPFDVAVIDSSNVNLSGDGVRLAKVYKEAGLVLEHDGLEEQDIEIKVIGEYNFFFFSYFMLKNS